MGGEPLYYFAQPKGILMRISDLVKRCVAFVGIHDDSGIRWGGTAFFVNVVEGGLKFNYLVTAKHLADELPGSDCVIRVNNRQGCTETLEANDTKWWFHATESEVVDCAVSPIMPKAIGLDVATISHTLFATPALIEEYGIGIGDEVYIAGLFSRVTETARNQPVVRTGNIVMMPDEKIDFPKIGLIDTYLVETKSFGGLSGCPVFVRHTVSTPLSEEPEGPPTGRFKRLYGGGSSYLLGSMIGRWVLPPVTRARNKASDKAALSEALNYGISPIVPMYKIMEVINQPELLAMRKVVIEDARKKREATAVLDTAFAKSDVQKTPEGLEIPVPTEDQFLSDLRKVSRKKN